LDNLVRSGTKQPNPISASAGGLAHPPFPLDLEDLQNPENSPNQPNN